MVLTRTDESRARGDLVISPGSTPEACNVAAHLPRMAAEVPDHPAVILPHGRRGGRARYLSLSFSELEALSNRYANGLTRAGITRGMRTLMMVRPGKEFIGLTFALFKMGAVPVMIDPGMGVRRLLECVRSVQPEAMIGIPAAQVVRVLQPKYFPGLKVPVTVGRRLFWGGHTLQALADASSDTYAMAATEPDEVAAILFTSGATGPAKGVVYQHGMFDAQVDMIRSHYGIAPGEMDLPAFPLFALFNPAMGVTSVIPDMDASRPAKVNPARIVEAIQDHSVTSTFGSPALWKRVAAYCVERGIKLPSVRRILIAGAPVPAVVIERLRSVIGDDGDIHTPYGATESLPVSSISGSELFGVPSDLDASPATLARSGKGTCVGFPLPGIDLRVIPLSDENISDMQGVEPVSVGSIGEIVVRGAVVTRAYANRPDATRASKIADGDDIWHRIGDVGYRDKSGRVWFCGRKNHRVETGRGTLYPIPCEALFNEQPRVSRSALVGVGERGRQVPVMVIEPESGAYPHGANRQSWSTELLRFAKSNPLTEEITHILFHRRFPVDVRHNAKINRELLSQWASEQLR
ncbi:MAG: fatty acid CoA ligase family protein [Phycisphaerae bacterium]